MKTMSKVRERLAKAASMDSATVSDRTSDGSYERGPHWELRKRRTTSSLSNGAESSQAVHTNPTAVEVHEWVQTSHCHQHDNTLRHGHLLRWMDITACLSGQTGDCMNFLPLLIVRLIFKKYIIMSVWLICFVWKLERVGGVKRERERETMCIIPLQLRSMPRFPVLLSQWMISSLTQQSGKDYF